MHQITYKTIDVVIAILALAINYFYYIKKGKINRTLLTIVSVIVAATWLYVRIKTAPDSNDYACGVYSFYKREGIEKERVIKKINLLHMMSQLIILKRLNEDKIDTFYFNGKESATYNQIKVGDTLVKKENNDSLFTLTKGKLTFLKQPNCGCDTNLYRKEHGNSLH